jgi:hypothetical protein
VQHAAASQADTDERKRVFLEAYGDELEMAKAAETAGCSRFTVWRMRRADPDFDAAVRELEPDVSDCRYSAVEESIFQRIINHSAPASLTIFWIVNESRRRGDHRWKHVHQIQQSTFPVDLDQCSEEELGRIAGGEDPASIFAQTRAARARPEDGPADDTA